MTAHLQSRLRRPAWRIFTRPLGWVGCAVGLVVILGLFHLLGWRDDTSFISGTTPASNTNATILRGMLYTLAWFSAILISPILILASGIRWLLHWLLQKLLRARSFRQVGLKTGHSNPLV